MYKEGIALSFDGARIYLWTKDLHLHRSPNLFSDLGMAGGRYGENIGKESRCISIGASSLLAVGVGKICFIYHALPHSYCPGKFAIVILLPNDRQV